MINGLQMPAMQQSTALSTIPPMAKGDIETLQQPGQQPMTDSELLSQLGAELSDVRGSYNSDIQNDREAALKAYNQEPYGDEQPGQSQVVSSDVRDVIEMMLPDLVEPLVGMESPVVFEPMNEGDVDAAERESDAVHYVYTQQNEGYLNTYTAAKDVLLSKNAYAMVYWDDYKSAVSETYTGLSLPQLAMIKQDPQVTITHGRVNETPSGPTFDVLCKRTRAQGQVCIQMLAPERVWVNRFHGSPNLDDARCVIVEELLTESDLAEQGYSEEQIKSIPAWSNFITGEEVERWKKEGGTPGTLGASALGSTKVVSILNYFIRIDYDGDGIAELRWVRRGGNCDVLLNNEEIDRIPVVSFAGIINTHKHNAVAVADTLLDIQKIRTVLTRQGLNRMYLENYGRTILGKGAGNYALGDLLAPRPGGVVRTDDMNAVKTDYPNPQPGNSLQWFAQIDTMRSDRVGINRDTNGMDPKSFNDMNNPIGMTILNRAQARLKMMLRNIVETGHKHMYLLIHELLMKHGSPLPMQRGAGFEVIDPREWAKRERMMVKVGTGSANRTEKMALAASVISMQKDIVTLQGGINGPFVQKDDIDRALSDWSRAQGATAGRYFSSMPNWAPPPPKQSPEELLATAEAKKVEADAANNAAKLKLEWQQQVFEQNLDIAKLTSSNYLKALEIEQHFGDSPDVTEQPVALPAPTSAVQATTNAAPGA